MKLHLNFPQSFLLGSTAPKLGFMAKTILQISKPKNINVTTKINLKLNKLLPQHWFDGVWDDLNVKM